MVDFQKIIPIFVSSIDRQNYYMLSYLWQTKLGGFMFTESEKKFILKALILYEDRFIDILDESDLNLLKSTTDKVLSLEVE